MEKMIGMPIFTALFSNMLGTYCKQITSSFINRNTFPNLQKPFLVNTKYKHSHLKLSAYINFKFVIDYK